MTPVVRSPDQRGTRAATRAPATGLSIARLTRLERRFSETIRFQRGARANLRKAIRSVAEDLQAQGASAHVARSLVRFVAENQVHVRSRHEVSLLGAACPAELIIEDMLAWIDSAYDGEPHAHERTGP
jgi:hypothetical protein